MRPHRLRVTAFGAFAGTEEIRFDDLEGLFLLHGETGAGKTTLLDAIAFALYGRVPGVRGKAKRLRSDHAAPGTRTEVRLEATIGGRALRITRRPEQERLKKSGAGMAKEHASVILEEADGDGWEVKSTRIGEADAEIGDLMGMSADQFFQVVLLPQGEFAQFLHADAPAREKLLAKLFGTDRFQSVEQWLAERRRTTASAVSAASSEVDHLLARVSQVADEPVPDEPDAAAPWKLTWLDGLTSEAKDRREEAAASAAGRKAELDKALTAKSAAQTLADRQRRRRDALDRREELDAEAGEIARLRAEAGAAARAAEIASVLDAADRAAAGAETAVRAEEEARAAIPDDHASLRPAGVEALRATGDEQQERLGRLDALRDVAREAETEEAAAADARNRAADLAEELAATETEAAGRQAERPAEVQARDDASQAAGSLPSAQAASASAAAVADDSAALASERERRERLAEEHLARRDEALTVREEATRLREARVDGMRAELAASLADGTPCPVCGSPDHPEPAAPALEPVSREREEQAYAAADEATTVADAAGQKVAAADATIASLTRRLTDAGWTVPAGAAALAGAVTEARADAERLEGEAAALKAAAAGLSGLQQALDDMDRVLATLARDQAELTEQRTAALAEAERASQRAARARQTLEGQLGGAASLDTALETARELADALGAAADAAEEAADAATDAREERERAATAAGNNGFGDPGAARDAYRDVAWRTETDQRIRRHESDVTAVAGQLAHPDLDVPLEPPAPVGDCEEAAAQAQLEHEEAAAAHGRAEHTVDQLLNLRPELAGALAALEPLTERADEARRLADLAGGLGGNQYKMTLSSFVLAARLEEVAAAASERLVTMTAGRYTLVHTDARKGGGRAGLGLLACDAWTGQDRDTSTLSGGETFLASLALALGLADVVTAESAGTPMEALFVDEGFGTLDEDTLEEVMNVLDGLRAGGRIVGIVSHVTELRQRIPARVHVRKGHHGSHVTVTTG